MILLLDLDGVVADFDKGFNDIWSEMYPEHTMPEIAKRKDFYIASDDDRDTKIKAYRVINSPDFYANLPLMEGAETAVKDLISRYDVYFVSSPGGVFYHAPSDKYKWVRQHFGEDMHKRLIITRTKHRVDGDILIDDKPNITTTKRTTWQHVLYTHNYNLHIDDKKRLTWADYREVLGEIEVRS